VSRFKYSQWLIVICLLHLSCANQIPPGGGPYDEEGPNVIYVYPEPYSLNVSTDRIEIEFDEYVDKRSASEAIFISPHIPDMEFDWSGSSVEITFPSELRSNTTYVVSIGTDVTDLEPSRKNRMSSSFSFPFSTGSAIDRGLLAGKVFPIKPGDELGGVMVYAYELPTGRADTLNVMMTEPTYVTQAAKDGSFVLPHVRLSSYLVMSLRDAGRNILYNKEEDEFGVPPKLARLSRLDTAQTAILLQLAVEDTTRPRLVGISPIDRNHLRLEFSEAIDTSLERYPIVTLQDTLTEEEKTVYAITPVLPSLKEAIAATDFLDPKVTYQLQVGNIYDPSGNGGRSNTSSGIFEASEKVDTLRPSLRSVSIRDSSTKISVSEEVLLTFSEPVRTDEWTRERVTFQDATQKKPYPYETRWVTESILGIRPVGELESASWYTLSVLVYGLKDWKLDAFRDSLSTVHFQTEDVYDTGAIEGVIDDRTGIDSTGSIIVIARSTSDATLIPRRTVAGAAGDLSLTRLSPGQYTLYAFKDRNNNGRYDAGLPFPYALSEWRSEWTDTLKVRSRWPLDGVRIRIP
jgi:hypothetical protein